MRRRKLPKSRPVKSHAQQLQEANAKLREAKSAKNEFFAQVSHELRTPLSLILASLESLLSENMGRIRPGSGLDFLLHAAIVIQKLIPADS